ncbi:helix-turn-helix transcriptional regulator [Comamonas testosteroni]|uniref:LexA family transcriptional regulator n=1 Tax=Comamonas testosteroni TaxID=285 RepID=UPI0023AA8BC0|nr:helix-turn-helix transcriptional regulator [Comamonas testosteroni]WEE79735.1 helix-turn-helix transcriptional regulator [Comamonas testosteroni]
MTLADRLSIAMEHAKLSQADLARACDVKPPSVHGWLNGKSKFLRGENLLKAASALGVNQQWLATGDGLMVGSRGDAQHQVHGNDASVSTRALSGYGAVPRYHAPDAVIVPILSNCGSMGPGSELLESDVIVGDLALSPHWINQQIRPQNPQELRFIHACGDSMTPTFTDGDVLLVDTGLGARDPSSREGVYVLQANGQNFIKRVTPTFDGKLQVTSDNPSSKTVQFLNGDHQVDVVGRVVWAWNGRKL